jgi:hypothetical protein
MASKRQKARKAAKAARTKTSRTQEAKRKLKTAKVAKPNNTTRSSGSRRSARVAARSAAKEASKSGKESKDDSRFVQILRTEKELPETLATIQRITRIKLLENLTDPEDRVFFLPGLSYIEKKALLEKLKPLPQRQRQKVYDKVSQAGIDKVLANTFGYRSDSAKDAEKHVWFWDQALGSWRHWAISGIGRVHETFHLASPPAVASAWGMQLKLSGHPGLDLRTQPAFYLAEDDSVKVVGMPLTIVTDHETWLSTEYLKTRDVDEAVSKRSRIPVESIVDPCLVIGYSQAVPRLVSDLPLYDPFTPLGFMWCSDNDDKDEDGDEEASDNAPMGMVCWDWVFSDFGLNVGGRTPVGDYLFQQDGDTYTLTLKKPDSLSKQEEAIWHAEVPYGPFASFARAVDATFWPPTPPAALNSSGVPQSGKGSNRISSSSAFVYPKSPFALASVPITRYRSGKLWDQTRLSNQARYFGVSTPALGDIATHLQVELPAQSSPVPVARFSRSPRSSRRTASAMNSPSQLS